MNDFQLRLIESLQKYEKTTNMKEGGGSRAWVFFGILGQKTEPTKLSEDIPSLPSYLQFLSFLQVYYCSINSRLPTAHPDFQNSLFFLSQTHCLSFISGQLASFPHLCAFAHAILSTWIVHCSVLCLVICTHLSDIQLNSWYPWLRQALLQNSPPAPSSLLWRSLSLLPSYILTN